MSKSFFLGEFNAEEYIKPNHLCKLPRFEQFDSKLMINRMDELLITMVREGDILLTKYPLPCAYKDYYHTEICKFIACNYFEEKYLGDEQSIFLLLAHSNKMSNILKNQDIDIKEYALIPQEYILLEKYNRLAEKPNLEAVSFVNSKEFSNLLKYKLDLPCKGVIVKSIREFKEAAYEMVEKQQVILIKEVYGVSGKGILDIHNTNMIDRLVRYFQKQQYSKFTFLLEPKLKKEFDFSCLLSIDSEGKCTIDGLQKNINRINVYKESESFESDKILNYEKYLYYIKEIAQEIYKAGYYGKTCIDSMVLKNGEEIPLVEINARMSMSRFNLMSNALELSGDAAANLFFFQVTCDKAIPVEKVIIELEKKGLLYKKGKYGFVPLAVNMWSSTIAYFPVRMFYQLVYPRGEWKLKSYMKSRLRIALCDIGFKVLNS